jgi:hypothetical protein
MPTKNLKDNMDLIWSDESKRTSSIDLRRISPFPEISQEQSREKW